jgi:methionine synthase I (cobalamin-dependent)
MAKANLKDRVHKGLFLLDGAMGTQLFARGVEPGKCNDYLNIESPDIVLAVHKAYIAAGSDAVLTNTFGANKFALARHGCADKMVEINVAGAKLARKAAGQTKYVLGDIGPCGDFLEPLGNLKADELKATFLQQAKALVSAGVDGLIIETMTALDEIAVAIEAAKSVAGTLPVFASMSFDKAGEDFRTMMGVDVPSAILKMVSLGADAVGFNCGTINLDEYVELAGGFVAGVRATGKDVFVYAEPNAGKPELVDGKAVYKVTPEEFASAAKEIRAAGVTIIGGCCGTGPEHIKAVAEKLRG